MIKIKPYVSYDDTYLTHNSSTGEADIGPHRKILSEKQKTKNNKKNQKAKRKTVKNSTNLLTN